MRMLLRAMSTMPLGRVVKTVQGSGGATERISVSCYDGLGRTVKTVMNPTVADPCGSYTASAAVDEDVILEDGL